MDWKGRNNVGIFNRKKANQPLPNSAVWTVGGKPEIKADYDLVMNWLIGLSEDDFNKVIKVAGVYRKADVDANTALGIETKPTTSIQPPYLFTDAEIKAAIDEADIRADELDPIDMAFLDEDEPTGFLDDDPSAVSPTAPATATRTTKKIDVKGEEGDQANA